MHDIKPAGLENLLDRYGMVLKLLDMHQPIEGSYWGDEEAGLVGNQLVTRHDTPVHSALHETCHYICMDALRRNDLNTDAGGDYDEENAVCFLQIVLSDFIDGFGRLRMIQDMNTWGYTFRLGCARAWFEQDAEDARSWLLGNELIDEDGQPAWKLRQDT